MATIAFAAIGSGVGSSLLGGIFGAAAGGMIGRSAGAFLGRQIDQHLFGSEKQLASAQSSFALPSIGEGGQVAKLYGRSRIRGQIIWASAVSAKPLSNGDITYTISIAFGLCEGVANRIGRIWVNDTPLDLGAFSFRFYSGNSDQMPDPKISENVGNAECPAYRGLSYVVFEDFNITAFGNSIPDIHFEVFRNSVTKNELNANEHLRAVTIIPGSGEYVYSNKGVEIGPENGIGTMANVHRTGRQTDFEYAIDQLRADCPRVSSTSLVVSWFGDNLDCSKCKIVPQIEQKEVDGNQAWEVSGVGRFSAKEVTKIDGNPVYGGTPSDKSVISAIKSLRKRNLSVMFYPFIMMDIPETNTLNNPWSSGTSQPLNPWRGRITSSIAAGLEGSPDQLIESRDEVQNFVGEAKVSDFIVDKNSIEFIGNNNEWSFKRFILHYAHLCKLAGGVDEFIIGSELRGLTSIRAEDNSFPFVESLILISNEVREILGPETKISYAADWSEYFGLHPNTGNGEVFFNLDPLWAHENIDFIGIDNYMPLTDWRNNNSHLDQEFGSIYNLDYLKQGVQGGEGYHWYYRTKSDRDNQIRTPITDGQSEPWIWRFKDLKNWWSNEHYNRPAGIREFQKTKWVPQSKPIYFTEYGCAAIKLSTNQPNKFLDSNSSESSLPYFSSGEQDSFIQNQYLVAFNSYWKSTKQNPISTLFDGKMINLDKAYCWTWDARPWPEFPGLEEVWSDSVNFSKGHWITSRVNNVTLASLVLDLCKPVGTEKIDVSKLFGYVSSALFNGHETIRQCLEKLMEIYQFDIFSIDGNLVFQSHGYQATSMVDEKYLVSDKSTYGPKWETIFQHSVHSYFSLSFIDIDAEYAQSVAKSNRTLAENTDVINVSIPFGISKDFAVELANYYSVQEQLGRKSVSFKYANPNHVIQTGDLITIGSEVSGEVFKVQRVINSLYQEVEAKRIFDQPQKQFESKVILKETRSIPKSFKSLILDIPIKPQSGLFIGFSSKPWFGNIAFFKNSQGTPEKLGVSILPVTNGKTKNTLQSSMPHFMANNSIEVEFINGGLESGNDLLSALFRTPMAIGPNSKGEFELIVPSKIDQISKNHFILSNVYRGCYGTEKNISNWSSGTQVCLIDQRFSFVSSEIFSNEPNANLIFGPPNTEKHWREETIYTPSASERPLTPIITKTQRVHDQLEITLAHRHIGDLDYWGDGLDNFVSPEKFKILISQGGQLIHERIGSDTQFQFEIDGGQEVLIEVVSISKTGLKSQTLKDTIYV